MRKIVGLVVGLCYALSATAQLKISISEITLKDGGTERYDSYAEPLTVNIKNRYITIAADVFNETSEPIIIDSNHSKGFVIQYLYDGVNKVDMCRILNPIYRVDGILSVPPKSTFKLFIEAFPDGLNSEEYLSSFKKTFPKLPDVSNSGDFVFNFIKIYPTITLKFADEYMNQLIKSSEPIKAKNFIVKSESGVAAESNSSESVEPDSDESAEPGTVLYI